MTLGGRPWAQVRQAVSAALASAGPGEQHLATEAVVAYVDGELSISAHERATRHLVACVLCTTEVAAQRQARTAVRTAGAPSMPPSLLAALHAIPHSAELPAGPDGLCVDEHGQFVVAQRPPADAPPLGLTRTPGPVPLGSGEPLGSSPPLGSTGLAAPAARRPSRRTRNGAGVVATGLVLGALALASPSDTTTSGTPRPGAESGGVPVTAVPARFEVTQRTPVRTQLVAPGLVQR